MRRCLCLLLACGLLLAFPCSAFAAVSWVAPEGDTRAEAAIVMDAKTGTVLWGKNINEQFYPASITKLMTALLVLERCELDETVTVTEEAVTNMEAGAGVIGLVAGDELSVEDLLYAMLLRSANDAANVLAVHVSGSIEAFAGEMTKRAAELGCRNTVFGNPSGLTRPENLTTAYDMALIGAACSYTDGFLEIEERRSFKIHPTEKNPDGLTVHAEHKMIAKGTSYTDARVIGGKTGFIKASGNTLVTIAEDENGMRLVAVVLKDTNPEHYKDTRMMLDFGFDNFENAVIEDPASAYLCAERLETDRIVEEAKNNILSYEDAVLTLPAGADPADAEVSYEYNLPDDAPELAVAKLLFRYDGIVVGSAYLLNDREADISILETAAEAEQTRASVSISAESVIRIAVGAAAVIAALTAVLLLLHGRSRKKQIRERRLENRRRRLEELHISESEFEEMVEDKRSRGKSGSGPESEDA